MRHSLLDTHQSFVGDGTPGSQNHKTFVADAYVAMRMTFEYLWRIHDRQGLDGNNGPQIHIETRSPEINNNAQWQVDKNRVIVARDDVDHYDYSSIDVIAHEIGHGLDSYGPRLTVAPPPPCPETNKIMEATADMFSMLASDVIEPTGFPYRIMEHPKKANWNGSTFTSTVAERYLDDPTINNKPACYSESSRDPDSLPYNRPSPRSTCRKGAAFNRFGKTSLAPGGQGYPVWAKNTNGWRPRVLSDTSF